MMNSKLDDIYEDEEIRGQIEKLAKSGRAPAIAMAGRGERLSHAELKDLRRGAEESLARLRELEAQMKLIRTPSITKAVQ